MRVFENLEDAYLELNRELSKSPQIISNRVQQRVDIGAKVAERIGITYAIAGGIPDTAQELVKLGAKMGNKFCVEHPEALVKWLEAEVVVRTLDQFTSEPPTENLHPALASCQEGNYFSYTYQERLHGAVRVLAETLCQSLDTRRAYWPIFQPMDALRACRQTRVPCSLGYEVMVREVGGENQMMLAYMQRSADFDTFWLSDVWLAHQFQKAVHETLCCYQGYPGEGDENYVTLGQFYHHIISFHSFKAANTEIY